MPRLSTLLVLLFCFIAQPVTASWDESQLEGLKWREIGHPCRLMEGILPRMQPSHPDYTSRTLCVHCQPLLSTAEITTELS
jgi:hypothetical protein